MSLSVWVCMGVCVCVCNGGCVGERAWGESCTHLLDLIIRGGLYKSVDLPTHRQLSQACNLLIDDNLGFFPQCQVSLKLEYRHSPRDSTFLKMLET